MLDEVSGPNAAKAIPIGKPGVRQSRDLQSLFTVFYQCKSDRLGSCRPHTHNTTQGDGTDVMEARSLRVRCEAVEDVFAVVDLRALWAAAAKTDLFHESAAVRTHSSDSSAKEDIIAVVRLTQRHAHADVRVLHHPGKLFEAYLPVSIQICFHDRLVHNLLQLLVFEIAAHHHLQHDEQFTIRDIAVTINIVDLEREP